ncbi:MAG: septation protein IspZ, partial [Geminicoccaceae bacterium]
MRSLSQIDLNRRSGLTMREQSDAPPAWVRPAADYGPLITFFVVYLFSGLMAATAAIVVTSLIALALTWG